MEICLSMGNIQVSHRLNGNRYGNNAADDYLIIMHHNNISVMH